MRTTLDERVLPNETTVPLLPCVAPEETLALWRALGFASPTNRRSRTCTWHSGGAGSSCTTAARRAMWTRLWSTPADACFIQRDEPADVEYGGSRKLQGLARVLDDARILREFENDDLAAFRALNSGLRRHGDSAPAVEQAAALAALIELSAALEQPDRVAEWDTRLRQLSLTGEERRRVESAVADPTPLDRWMPPSDG